jgi:hypothetical protein
MESSRDSSIWRNLAVTFGGGLALGAVGMKLTQTALRPAEAHPRPEVHPRPEPDLLTDRLSMMERRLERMEQTPAPARPASSGQAAGATFDQKVLEAVIGAVEARLHEHAGQMDRRWADLEARLAVMQSVHDQDRRAGEQLRAEAAALHAEIAADMRQVRESAARSIAGQTAIEGAFDVLRQRQESAANATAQRLAEVRQELRQEFRSGLTELRTHVEQSIEARVVTAAAAAAAARMEEQLSPLRSEIQQKEKELGELRQRLADSEQSVLDVILSIGMVCRQAAEHIGGPRQPAPPAAPVESSSARQPNSEAATPVFADTVIRSEAPAPAKPGAVSPPAAEPTATARPEPMARIETPAVPGPALDPALAPAIPDFLHQNNYRGNWRVPLVSAALLSSGYLLLMHYLSVPLQ